MRRWCAIAAVVVGLSAAGCSHGVGGAYESHFDRGAGPEWSVQQIERSPKGGRTFLGPGLNEPMTLTVSNMPSHRYVRISFDLLVLDSWDGSGRKTLAGDIVGPDCWRMSLADGRVLMWHTFSTTPNEPGFSPATMVQTYPSPVAGDKCPANAGAAAVNSLGYVRDYGGDAQFRMDAVYHVSMVVPHREREIGLEFKGYGLQPISHWTDYRMDEGWGVDHVKVEPLSDVKVCSADEARALLERAAAPGDPAQANEAYLQLLAGGDGVRRACQEAMRAARYDETVIGPLARDAQSADPAVSAPALRRLDQMGGLAERTLWELSRPGHPPQVRDAAVDMLKEFHPTGNDSVKRKAAVANRVMEVIGPAD